MHGQRIPIPKKRFSDFIEFDLSDLNNCIVFTFLKLETVVKPLKIKVD